MKVKNFGQHRTVIPIATSLAYANMSLPNTVRVNDYNNENRHKLQFQHNPVLSGKPKLLISEAASNIFELTMQTTTIMRIVVLEKFAIMINHA